RRYARLAVKLLAIERPAATILDSIVGECVVPLNGRKDARIRKPELLGVRAAQHQKSVGSRAWHHTIEQSKRIGDQTRGKILFERERFFHQGGRKVQDIAALRDAKLAEILGFGAIGPHVISGEEGKARIGSA